MATITFDTLKFAKRLKEAGFTETQAEVQAQALAEALQQSGQGIATKADLNELEHRIAAKLYQALLVQTFAVAGLVTALVKLL